MSMNKRAIAFLLTIVMIVGFITVVSLFLCGSMIDWTNTPEELKSDAKIYMSIIILAKPFGAKLLRIRRKYGL